MGAKFLEETSSSVSARALVLVERPLAGIGERSLLRQISAWLSLSSGFSSNQDVRVQTHRHRCASILIVDPGAGSGGERVANGGYSMLILGCNSASA
jgi:hypothetical protein